MSVSDIHQMPLSEIRGKTPASPRQALQQYSRSSAPHAFGESASGQMARGRKSAPLRKPLPRRSQQPPRLLPLCLVHSDTAKILVIVGIAAGAVVGVALGLGGGKSSTVSPE